jgi:hypothetical protein
MNVSENAVQAGERGVFRSNEPALVRSVGVRVEPCEFEALLERAMEILSVRARAAATSGS